MPLHDSPVGETGSTLGVSTARDAEEARMQKVMKAPNCGEKEMQPSGWSEYTTPS